MIRATRRARVTALAKLNLDLHVLYRRPDQYHELRSIFQTISLGDAIDISFTPGRKTDIMLEDCLHIPDNIMLKAAGLVMAEAGPNGRVEFRLEKRIPMGSGLGGGSSDAAAVLLALPVLAGRAIDERTDRMLFARCDDVVLGCGLLQDQPLRAHVIAGVAPVAQRVEVAEIQAVV